MNEDKQIECPFCFLKKTVLRKVNTPIGDRFQCEECKTLFDETTMERLNVDKQN